MPLVLLQVGCPDKAREAPLALKALYDADVAEEDIILAWHERADAAKVTMQMLLWVALWCLLWTECRFVIYWPCGMSRQDKMSLIEMFIFIARRLKLVHPIHTELQAWLVAVTGLDALQASALECSKGCARHGQQTMQVE